MAAAEDSKSFGSDTVWVRIPSWPPEVKSGELFDLYKKLPYCIKILYLI